MDLSYLYNLSPLDGRYRAKLSKLRPIASEFGLIYLRLIVEIRWLIRLSKLTELTQSPPLDSQGQEYLENIIDHFDLKEAEEIKSIEKITNHDVKAIEYYIHNKIKNIPQLNALIPFIHFGCTSEDINNLAYGLMLSKIRNEILSPAMQALIDQLSLIAQEYAQLPMLSRTHGQTASPTTLGKEIVNFIMRLSRQQQIWQESPILGKFNGAIGNFNAHFAAAPETNWPEISKDFITSLGLTPNLYTTQIEPHDNLAELLQALSRFNTIMIDLNRDIWGYISLGYFGQKKIDNEIGSSTMPHKINPIDFENSEGNLGIANALAAHFCEKLPISRWQRDLSDSTVLRNLGSIAGYSLIAYQSALKGLEKLTVNQAQIESDLAQHWEVLAEAIQSVLRRHGIVDAYERLKDLTRGKTINQENLNAFIQSLTLPFNVKQTLLALKPDLYLGYAIPLTSEALKK